MPAIDYKIIKEKIRDILAADSDLSGMEFYIDNLNDFDVMTPSANIEMVRRTAVPGQSISMGTRTRYEIECSIIVGCASLEHGISNEQRDRFLRRIEVVLIANRKLENLVNTLWLTGGELINGVMENGGYYFAGGQVNFIIDAVLTTE